MEKRHLPIFNDACARLQGGAYIRYGIGPQMLLCDDNPTNAMRENIEDMHVSELYAQKLIERDPRSVTLDQTPEYWPWEQRVATVQKYVRYTWRK